MPELPEVETVKRSFESTIQGQKLKKVTAFRKDLRFSIPQERFTLIEGKKLSRVRRRGKYLLLDFEDQILLSHLGMSGYWRFTSTEVEGLKHDHLLLNFSKAAVVYNDPRRFGFIDIFGKSEEGVHPRLSHLGPEPLEADFNGAALQSRAARRESNVKSFIMNSEVVVGVGNIYAVEALFRARIHPKRSVARISAKRWDALAASIKEVLTEAIAAGGSTIRDFRSSSGESGYFQRRHDVYGRGGEPCRNCGGVLKSQPMSGRATVWCPQCQK